MTKLMETNNYGLYVHIPFCVSKCFYCDFASVKQDKSLINEYTNALCSEIKMHKAKFSHITFDTVFIGGGTPSCIPQDNLEKIIKTIYDSFNTQIKEFTIEINPGTGNEKLFQSLKALGVNRASIGLQCANDEVLKSIGRIHDVSQYISTVETIKNVGIDNFSTDIITGLPKQTTKDVISSINLANELGAKHISMYSLKLEEGTPLEVSVSMGKTKLPTIDEEYHMSAAARNHLESLGYHRYEISNYAKNTYESKHNLKYWNRVPYLGVGVTAASMYKDIRRVNTNSIRQYIAAVDANSFPEVEISKLSKEEIAFEIIMLSTRLNSGMEYSVYNNFTGENFINKFAPIMKELKEENLIIKSNTHFALTPKGMDVQNQILLKFMD